MTCVINFLLIKFDVPYMLLFSNSSFTYLKAKTRQNTYSMSFAHLYLVCESDVM